MPGIRRWMAFGMVAACAVASVGCGGGDGGGGSTPAGTVTLLTETLPPGLTGVLYEAQLEADLPNPPGIFILASGQLPNGVTLDPVTGAISGYPHNLGVFRFDIEVRDGPDQSAPRDFTVGADRQSFTLNIGRGPVNFIPQTPPTAQYRASYGYVFDVAGGTPPYTFQLTGGSLPAGIVVTPGGLLGSFPTQASPLPYQFQVTVTDSVGGQDTEQFQILVVVLPLVIATSTLPPAAQGFPYETQITLASAGGGSPYVWSQVFPLNGDTDLASIGLEIRASDGTIRVKPGFDGPTAVGTFSFRVQVQDEAGQIAERAFSLTVNPGPVITSISPNRSILPGPYTVTGLNFQDDAVLVFAPGTPDEVVITPTFVSDTTLTFATAPFIPGGAVAVRVENPDGGFFVKANAFLYPFSNLSFGQKGFIDSALSSTGVAAGDLDGDGLAEVVHTGSSGILTYTSPAGAPASNAAGIHLFRNQGGLTFTAQTLDTASYFDVKIADVNTDGKPDIVALTGSSVRTWINDPLGTLTPGPSSALPNDSNFLYPEQMTIARLNADTIPDILFTVAHFSNPSGRAYSMVGSGTGLFTLAGSAVSSFAGTNGCLGCAAVDLNNDGRQDPVVLGGWNNSQGPTFRHTISNVDGTFGSWTNSANSTGTSWGTNMSIATGNFLGNGTPAVITVHTEDPGDGGQRELKLWSGPSLTTGQVLTMPGPATAPAGAGKVVIAADFDLDLFTDFAISWNPHTTSSGTPTTNGSVNVYKGSTKASIQQLDLTTGLPAISTARAGRMATGDLDGDGKDDLLVCTSFWAFDYQPQNFGVSFSLRLAGNGAPLGVAYYLNSSN